MFQLVSPFRHGTTSHGVEQLGPGGGQLMRRLGLDQLDQLVRRRQINAVPVDQSTKRLAITQPLNSAGEQREVDVAAGLLPRTERAGGNIGADAFG